MAIQSNHNACNVGNASNASHASNASKPSFAINATKSSASVSRLLSYSVSKLLKLFGQQ